MFYRMIPGLPLKKRQLIPCSLPLLNLIQKFQQVVPDHHKRWPAAEFDADFYVESINSRPLPGSPPVSIAFFVWTAKHETQQRETERATANVQFPRVISLYILNSVPIRVLIPHLLSIKQARIGLRLLYSPSAKTPQSAGILGLPENPIKLL